MLKELDLLTGDRFSNAATQSLIHARPNLVVLKINVHLGNHVMACIGTHCRHLRVLYITLHVIITPAAVRDLVQGCPLLEDLDFYDSVSNADKVITAVAEFCHRLRHTNLVPELSDQGLIALSRGCPDLRDFDT